MTSTGARRLGVAVAAAVCLTAGLAVACRSSGGGRTSTPNATVAEASPTASTPPEEALRLYVQRRLGQNFVANCDDARRPDDIGKQCARRRGERNGFLAYELGPTFSEYTRLIILGRADGSWTIAHLENHDPNAPPVPGIPWPLQVGVTVVVAGTQDCLRIRQRPGVNQPLSACLDDGTMVTVDLGPVELDNFEWWHLKDQGWAAGAWLRYPEGAGPTPTPH